MLFSCVISELKGTGEETISPGHPGFQAASASLDSLSIGVEVLAL